jgi:hypothetical protein
MTKVQFMLPKGKAKSESKAKAGVELNGNPGSTQRRIKSGSTQLIYDTGST